jgi:hypothetical protein
MDPNTVRFDFRFSSNKIEHEEKKDTRQQLVREFAVRHAGESNLAGVDLYPVARAGKSGSEVFYLDLSLTGFGFPERFIAKFQSRDLTEREQQSARRAQVAKLCSKVFSFKHPHEDVGLIVYDLATARDHIEFRGYFLDPNNSDELCAEGLKSIFQLVGRHPNTAAPTQKLISDYSWYLGRRTQPLQRIQALADMPAEGPSFRDVSESVLKYYKRIESHLNLDVHPYLVHGDLHARTLLLSRSNPARAELIDFGWVHFGHPVKDFALMESTLKYMLLPEFLPIARGTSNDPLLPAAGTIEDFERLLWANGLALPSVADFNRDFLAHRDIPRHQKQSLLRVYRCLQEVRAAAAEVLQGYCMTYDRSMDERLHYFSGAFLMTFSLLGIQELEQFWALIGLNVIGSHL